MDVSSVSLLHKELRQTCVLLGAAAGVLSGYLGLALFLLRILR